MVRRTARQSRSSSHGTSLSDRLIAAVLSPLFFNVALLIVAATSRRGHMFGSLMYLYTSSGLGGILMLALPAAVGFVMGSSGLGKLMGHAFMTNTGAERNIILTLMVWCAFAVCFYLALDTLPE